jgi:hypothetical protein
MEAGQGMSLVMGFEKEEAFRDRAGAPFGLVTLRGFGPPSCIFVGIVVVGREGV